MSEILGQKILPCLRHTDHYFLHGNRWLLHIVGVVVKVVVICVTIDCDKLSHHVVMDLIHFIVLAFRGNVCVAVNVVINHVRRQAVIFLHSFEQIGKWDIVFVIALNRIIAETVSSPKSHRTKQDFTVDSLTCAVACAIHVQASQTVTHFL